MFEFVEHGDGIVFDRNPAAAVSSGQQLIGAEAEDAGAPARGDYRRRTEHGPVQCALPAQQLQSLARAFCRGFVCGRKGWRVDQLLAGGHFQRASPTYNEQARRLRLNDRADDAAHAGHKVLVDVFLRMAAEGADDSVGTFELRAQRFGV